MKFKYLVTWVTKSILGYRLVICVRIFGSRFYKLDHGSGRWDTFVQIVFIRYFPSDLKVD